VRGLSERDSRCVHSDDENTNRDKMMTVLQSNKTKLVCTIGPASDSRQLIEKTFLSRVENPAAVLIPTTSGTAARGITRVRLSIWILAASPSQKNVPGAYVFIWCLAH